MPYIANSKIVSFSLKKLITYLHNYYFYLVNCLVYSDTLNNLRCHNTVFCSFILLLPV